MKCSLLLAVFASFLLSAATAQIKVPPGSGQNLDIVVTREGQQTGQLSGCVGDSCRLGSVSIARARIVWIGLKSDIRSIPTPTDRLRDEVHYRDGSVHPGRLVGIAGENVVTERGRHTRAVVAWIYLAPIRQTPDPGPIGVASPTPLPSPTATPPPTPSPTPDRTSTPVPNDTATGQPPAGKRGGLWVGKIIQRWVNRERGVERITTTIDSVSLREYVQPISIVDNGKLRQVGTNTHLVAEAGRISEVHRERYPNNGGICSVTGEGTATLRGTIESSSFIWKKTVNVDTTGGLGWNVPSGPGVYFVGLSIHTLEDTYPTTSTCIDRDGTHVYTEKRNFHTLSFGRIPPNPDPVDSEVRILDSTGGRMTGSYTSTRITRGNGRLTVSWNICREGVTCAGPPSAGGDAISLGNLFETDLAVLLADAQPKLDGVVSKIQTDAGLLPEIRMMIKEGGDSVFLETLGLARIEALKRWFAQHGINAQRISWTWETGASDQVLIAY